MNKTHKKIIILITCTIFLTGCGASWFEGKLYFESNRFPRVKGVRGSSFGTSVYSKGRIKDLYNEYRSPAVTKDGKLLVGYDTRVIKTMVITNLKTKEEKIITLPHVALDFRWFPDGEKIAISGYESKNILKAAENIYIYDINTGKEKKVTNYVERNKRINIFDFEILMRGNKIAYKCDIDTKGKIRILDLDTGDTQVLPYDRITAIGVDSINNSSILLLLRSIYVKKIGKMETQFIFHDVENNKLYKEFKISGNYQVLKSPTFSPDGKQIAYVKIDNAGAHSIWVIDVDGKNERPLIKKNYLAKDLSWTK